jgi:RNA polymerase sigma factor (sigma-70 family)
MLRIQAGQGALLAVLYDRYQKQLFNFFVRLGHTRTNSEDLVQDTFLRVLRLGKSYRGQGYFIGWLYQIARNVAHDAWQHSAGLESLEEDETAAEMPASAEHEPTSLFEHAALERRLQNALLQLPAESRELVVLSRVTELSNDELAQLFDCSVGALKVRLHRALQQLREHFENSSETRSVKRAVTGGSP